MTTLKEISNKLNIPQEYDFFPNMMNIDIGNHTFTDVKQHDDEGFLYLYSNKNNPKAKLLFNEDRQAVILYELLDNNKVKATTWRMGKKFEKNFDKSELNDIF